MALAAAADDDDVPPIPAHRVPTGTPRGLALLAACMARVPDPARVRNLLEDCATAEDLLATDMYSTRPFLLAASSAGMADLLAVFVTKGQDLHAVDDEGSTALHAATLNNQPESVRALLALGIDTTRKTTSNAGSQTALEIAEEDDALAEIANILREH